MATDPITVSIRREVDPAHIAEATAWVQTGVNLANKYPGFLGSGWVRAGEASQVWHMLYRFANEETLEAWERSPERSWWLSMGEGFVRSERSRRRTGIEGWFDAPVVAEVSVPASDPTATRPVPPPRWKQAVTIWLAFFPLNLLATVTLGRLLADVPVVLRVAALTLALTPIMTYLLLPWMTARLEWWLHGRRFRDR